MLHDVDPLLVGDDAGQELAVRLERRDDVAHLALRVARLDRATVDHQRRAVQARHRHHAARHVLVAARDGDQPVVPLRAHHGLDRIRDEVPRRQRVAHAVGAHRQPVTHADRVEAQPYQTSTLNTGLDLGGQAIEVHVARVALVPHAADADLRLLQIHVGQADAVEHRLRRALAARLGDAG
jgi:hypothetical protein